MEQSKRLTQQWLQSVVDDLKTGEELLLPAKSKQEAREKLCLFLRELKTLSQIDSVSASQLQIVTRFKDHRFWLVIKKVSFSPFIAFKKGRDGEVERVLMDDSSEKRRRLLLMKEDGYKIEEIEEIEGSLNEEELILLK